jgi:hypothetical protein
MCVGVGTKSTHGYRYKIVPTDMCAGMSLHPLVLKIQRIPIPVIIKLAGADTGGYRTRRVRVQVQNLIHGYEILLDRQFIVGKYLLHPHLTRPAAIPTFDTQDHIHQATGLICSDHLNNLVGGGGRI